MSLPQIVTGDLWDEIGKADILAVTTNAVLRRDGTLTMGAGSAREMVERYSGIDREFGRILQDLGPAYFMRYGGQRPSRPYGFLISSNCFFVPKEEDIEKIRAPMTRMAIFQTKWHFTEPSDLELIRYSCESLVDQCRGLRVAIPYPGAGLGGLSEEIVRPILMAELPPEVVIYKRR